MARRIATRILVTLLALVACYAAWFWAWLNVLPPDFGMPEHEEELEAAFIVSSVLFLLVPLALGHGVTGYLTRRWPGPHPPVSPDGTAT